MRPRFPCGGRRGDDEGCERNDGTAAGATDLACGRRCAAHVGVGRCRQSAEEPDGPAAAVWLESFLLDGARVVAAAHHPLFTAKDRRVLRDAERVAGIAHPVRS